jgi:hypothetical protein
LIERQTVSHPRARAERGFGQAGFRGQDTPIGKQAKKKRETVVKNRADGNGRNQGRQIADILYGIAPEKQPKRGESTRNYMIDRILFHAHRA